MNSSRILSDTDHYFVRRAAVENLKHPADLLTILKQIKLFHLQLKRKIISDTFAEERDLLAAWQLTFAAEGEVDTIRTKAAMINTIVSIHNQILEAVSAFGNHRYYY